ncbi:MAG: hypothetical protein U1A27_11455 [Phycisphaerae bacterium]
MIRINLVRQWGLALAVASTAAARAFAGEGHSTRAPAAAYAERWNERVVALRERLAEAQRAAGTLSAGAARDAVRERQLGLQFELETLTGGTFADLTQRVEEVRRAEPGPGLVAECDYWQLRIELARSDAAATSQPERVARVRRVDRFLAQHPRSPRVPGLVAESWAAVDASGDAVTARRWLELLEAGFPRHVTTAHRRGAERLRAAVGEAFAPDWSDSTGQAIDWRALRGSPVVAVYAAAWDAESRRLMERLAGWSGLRSAMLPRLIVVLLDRRAETASALLSAGGLKARVICDGRGWGADGVEAWGVRALPVALVIDGSGTLRGAFRAVDDASFDRLEAAWRAAGGAVEPTPAR